MRSPDEDEIAKLEEECARLRGEVERLKDDWIYCSDNLPDEDAIVECAAVSGYDGSLYRLFASRIVDCDGWCWATLQSGTNLDDNDFAEADDVEVIAWRKPTPLPPRYPRRSTSSTSGPGSSQA
jgi:hypothetical protein